MSKVKHLLRKLHIGDHQNQGRPPPLDPSPQATPSASSSPPSNLPQSVSSSENGRSGDSNFNFFEEEFQMQLALAISVSDQGQNCVDPETAQINAAKQISLGCAPSQNLAEFLSLRYWSCNVVNYDEKVTDAFYDVFGLDSNLVIQAKLPSLIELESISPLDDNGCEVVLVNRAIDVELRKLEEQVHFFSLECHALDKALHKSFIVQKIADLVVQKMGGPVSDVEEMFMRWRARTHELRVYLNTFILPLGSLDIGHSRQRALLFKVLADRINLPCKLVKGSYYTGTDEGAVNLIKLDDGSEYIIDLMGAPGTLIPSEVPIGHYQNFGLDSRGIVTVAGTLNMGETPKTSTLNLESSASAGKVGIIQPKQMEHGLEDLNPPQWRSSKESLHTAWNQPTIQGLQNEENCASETKNLFPNTSSHDVGEEDIVLRRNVLLWREANADWCHGGVYRSHIPFSGLLNEDQIARARDTSDGVIFFNDTVVEREVDCSGNTGVMLTYCSYQSDVDKVHNFQIDSALNGVAEILWEDLQIGERIGIGSYGEVYRAEWNGTEVAVKKFMNQDISGDALTQFKCEVEIMLRLRHPNVVLFMGAVTCPPNMSILTEYLPRGSLYKLLHRPNIQIDEKRRTKMALDVAKGMNYLHTSHPTIVHRDLKTPNLLVDKNWVVKVCDFGMSRLQHHTFLSSKSAAGTAEWMAPEVLRNEPSNEKSDVFSFGVILWELATLQVPWMGMNSMQVVGAVGFQGKHLEIPSTVNPLVQEIISDCWNRNPQARPSFAQIILRLKHLQRLSVQKPDIRINHQ